MHITKLHLVDCFVSLCLKFYYKLIADLKNYSYNASKNFSTNVIYHKPLMSHAQKITSEYMLGTRYITLFGVFFFVCSQDIDRKKTWSIYNLEHYFLLFFLIQACIINFTFLFICFIRQIWWNCWYSKKKDMKNVLKKKNDSFMILHIFMIFFINLFHRLTSTCSNIADFYRVLVLIK